MQRAHGGSSARAMPAAILIAVVAGGAASLSLTAADWPRFRGPQGAGVSAETGLPTRWSDTEGVAWRTKLPGPGSSSPIVSGGKVFVTCYSGYGIPGERGGELGDLRRHVVCVDRESGKILWDRSFGSNVREAGYAGIGIPRHGYASSTPVADGQRVYAFFGTAGVIAYDFAGEQIWHEAVAAEPRTHMFGSGSSPILFENLLIVPASIECEEIVAFDKRTGAAAWRSPATGYGGWWGTPTVVDAGDRKDLIISVPDEIWGLNPANGKLRWYAESFAARAICTSVVVADGIAYAIGGREGGSAAVRIGGKGDVTPTHRLWSSRDGAYVPSPVYHDGHLYWVTDRGLAYCLEAKTGKRVESFSGRVEGSVYASPLAADGKLYIVTQRDGTYVMAAKPERVDIAHNAFESDDSTFNASPAVSDGRLLLRSDRFLYCVGPTKR